MKRTSVFLTALAATALISACSDGDSTQNAAGTFSAAPSQTQSQPTTDGSPTAAGPSPTLGQGSPDSRPAPAAQDNRGPCTVDTALQSFKAHESDVPPPFPNNDDPDAGWAFDRSENSGFTDAANVCAPLGYVTLGIRMPTGSSPIQIVLFHNGQYIGVATKKAYAKADVARIDGSSIRVTWRFPRPGESNAEASGETEAQFRWDSAANKVVMTGDVPDY
ncbi:LppP/LprE family lipoprotein [Corynebacterium heidelbergense]|uniref:LppP/LprE family lipoprotein n=1 Tax=Corynebacterium heidelbergense TaxID=2055947 RepID=A0A364V3Y9_9CORY|nr:LppP/LprE family lipoprotein [Corynebacterium heidelbergense]RAV31347.1 hypothetical protein DLJ54_08860 [Corynebacterium heidelbergense]